MFKNVKFCSQLFIDETTDNSYYLSPLRKYSSTLFLISNSRKPRVGETRCICGVLFVAAKSPYFYDRIGVHWVHPSGDEDETQKVLKILQREIVEA